MHTSRNVAILFVVVLLLGPLLSACGPSAGIQSPVATVAQTSETGSSQPADAQTQEAATPTQPAPAATREPLPPLVIGIQPETGQEQALGEPVKLTFDQPMDPTSTAAAFSIEPSVKGKVKVSGSELTFTPEKELERSTQYTVAISDTAKSASGLPMQEVAAFQFSTVGFLEVSGAQPPDQAMQVSIDNTISVAFNRPVVPLTTASAQSSLPEPIEIEPATAGSGKWLNTSIYEFQPEDGLAASTQYTVTVKQGLTDTAGALLPDDYTFTFRTADPVIVGWMPETTENVRIESPITVTFSIAMDRASTEEAFKLTDEQGEAVVGSFTWLSDDTVLQFSPDKRLEFGMVYQAMVAETARPAVGEGGLRVDDNQRTAFTTVSLPKVARTDPKDADKKADPYGGVTLYFASPMNPASFVTGTVTVLPEQTKVITSYNEWENSLYIGFDRLPSATYTVTLSAAVKDPYGNRLGKPFTMHFTTRDYDPSLQLSSTDQVGTYNAYTKTEAVLIYRNVDQIDLTLYKTPVDDFLALTGNNSWQVWENYTPKSDTQIKKWSVTPDAKRNQTMVKKVALTGADNEQLTPGLYFFTAAKNGILDKGGSSNQQVVARTDLNVTLKSTEIGALAWVTDLKSGLPVPGVTVRFTDGEKLDLTATTDSDGIAEVSIEGGRSAWAPLLALASTESGSFGVTSAGWQSGISPWDFNLEGGGPSEPYTIYVYTDRPIYRPGQTIHWKALVRRDDDAAYSLLPVGRPITATLVDGQGSELYKQELKLSADGTISGDLVLGSDASLGYYYVSVMLTDQMSYGINFQVAEYRKPEYEIGATASKPEYVQGEQISVTAQASYYFGGPVKNAKVSWVLMTGDYSFRYTGEGNFSFTDWDWYEGRENWLYGGQVSQGEGVTDSQGRFTLTVPADVTKYTQSQQFTFDITITDANNQAVSTQALAVVHKADFYIGLSPRRYVATVGDTSQVDVITVDPKSQPVAKTRLTLVANRMEWYSVRELADDGRYYWTAKVKKTPVFTDTLTTDADGKALFAWTPTAGGEYKIEANGRDRAGHPVKSSAYVWVSDREFVSWRQDNNDRIELVADRDEYEVGDTAEILVPSPYQGKVKALLTIERNHLLSHKVIELEGNSEVLRIPIDADLIPNAYVSLVLMKGMDETSPAPSFKMGVVQLNVSVASKKLQVLLTPSSEKVGPRDTVTWTVQTLDAAGKPVQADVSLALVDKSVLALASDSSGLLMDRFYSRRTLGVRTAATLVVNIDRIVAQLPEGGKGGGGGGFMGEMGLSVRSEFPDVAFWQASVTTGADGKAQVEVKLPDNLTTWTMDARAITKDTLVGQTTSEIVATKDLIVRPVLPRFFIEGDQAEIAAVIQNNSQAALPVKIALQATGLNLPDTTQESQTVPAGGSYKAVWPVTVLPNIDEITVLMSAAATSVNDAVEITIPVYRYSTPEVMGTSGQVNADSSRLELVRLPGDIDPTRAQLDVQLEPSLAAGMIGGLTYLEHYPYECVEQTMSRFLPNVVSYQALKELGLSDPELETVLPQEVGVGLQKIYGRQHVDGGWGWWQTDDSNPYISSYVVFGLAKAKEAGFLVDQDVLNRGIRFLKRSLGGLNNLAEWEMNQQAFVLYALAEAGDAEPNRAGALFEARERLSLYGKAYLAQALNLIGDDAAAQRIQTLLADITGQAITTATSAHWEEGYQDLWNMGSDTRTTSIVLDTLALLEPEHSLGPNTVRWLMSARKADRWETTQENAWAIIALTDWMAATHELEGDYNWKVNLNGSELGAGAVTPETVDQVIQLSADVTKLLIDETNGLSIQRSTSTSQTGAGQLYYTTHLKTYLPVEKIEPLDRGLVVSREYHLADCETNHADLSQDALAEACPAIQEARVGDVMNVRLTIVVPNSLQFVVIEDPLPAGAESVDTSLRTTSAAAEGPEVQMSTDEGPHRWWMDWWWTPSHTELRDEKTAMFATHLAPGTYTFSYQIRASLPGSFLTLPPTGYEMYFPEVWGRGAGSIFTITE